MKRFAFFFIAALGFAAMQAQSVVIFPKSGDSIVYKISDIDHIEFLPTTPEGPSNPTEEVVVSEFPCMRDTLNIYGKLYRPASVAADVALPTVVLSHSANLTADAMNAYAMAVAKEGFCAYAFDFCGACDESRSDGSTNDMTPFTEVADLKAVIAAMKANPGVNPDKICLLGSSLGGFVSALTAEDSTLSVAGLVLFYPAFNIPDLVAMMDQFGGGGSGGGFGGFGGMSYSEAFCSSMRDYDVYANIGTFSKDVLILHGSNDMIVKISYSEKAVETYPHATLITIDGANHGFNADNLGSFGSIMGGSTDYDSVVIPHLLNYLNTHLK